MAHLYHYILLIPHYIQLESDNLPMFCNQSATRGRQRSQVHFPHRSRAMCAFSSKNGRWDPTLIIGESWHRSQPPARGVFRYLPPIQCAGFGNIINKLDFIRSPDHAIWKTRQAFGEGGTEEQTAQWLQAFEKIKLLHHPRRRWFLFQLPQPSRYDVNSGLEVPNRKLHLW